MSRKKTNFDVFKEELLKNLKPETVCRTIMCNACPFKDKNVSGCTECNEQLLEWLRQEAKS